MKIVDFECRYDVPVALALGFFDCIHLGHRALIRAAQSRAREIGAESALLTFRNDMGARFGAEKQIYTFEERAMTLAGLKVDALIAAKFDDGFTSLSPVEFFGKLTQNFDIKAIFVGRDYTFGKGGKGNIATLQALCDERGIELRVTPFETFDGEKISTSRLKELVKAGDMQRLNALLGAPYLTKGVVTSNRKVGRSIGFPTANLAQNSEKLALGSGIYATTLTVGGKTYRAMTNVGDKPTFNDSEADIETYAFDFDGDLYGKEIEVRFYLRTRDIKKFTSVEELKAQLAADEAYIKALPRSMFEI